MTKTTMQDGMAYRRLCIGLAGGMVLLLGTPAISTAQPMDPARCEARKLQKEAAYYDCLSRCERRAGRVRADECDGRCESAFDAAIFRVEDSAPCQPPEEKPTPEPGDDPPPPTPTPTAEPDPEKCEAQLLQVEARHLLCRSRCGIRAARNASYDRSACEQGCNERCTAATDKTLAKPICAAGRMPEGAARQAEQ